MLRIFLLISVLAFSCPFLAFAGEQKNDADQEVLQVYPKSCKHGLQHQPKGPFAVMVFCEDALGTYIAVVCYDAGKCAQFSQKADKSSVWEFANRVWQEKIWASDVTSIAWAGDGKGLYVATDGIYGSGGMFYLDLVKRAYTQLLPLEPASVDINNPGKGYIITAIDTASNTLSYLDDIDAPDNKKVLSLSPNSKANYEK